MRKLSYYLSPTTVEGHHNDSNGRVVDRHKGHREYQCNWRQQNVDVIQKRTSTRIILIVNHANIK